MLSEAEVRIYAAFAAAPNRWLMNTEVAEQVGLSVHTVKPQTRNLSAKGVLDCDQRHRRHRFRLAASPEDTGAEYVAELSERADVLGIELGRKVEGRPRPLAST